MAFFNLLLCFLVFFIALFLSTQQREITKSSDYSLSFSLTIHSLSHISPLLNALSISTNTKMKNPSSSSSYNYKSSFKYSMALINPNSDGFQYVDLLTFGEVQRMPNFDLLAYTVGLEGIRIGGKRLNISSSAFRTERSGAGQTMVDSGTEYTFLVEEAYNKVREEVVRLAGPKIKKGYVYGGSLDMCFDGYHQMEIGRLVGDMVLEFEKGVEIVVPKERILSDAGDGVKCMGIGWSEMLGIESNIIGNFHQQNVWVEFDLANRRVGFGRAKCS
ncbi:Xylanase inhibitor, C-terminal [Dillenia turbinata]|uniref:Xylanase inhibitor, C-terminal n=1 Tax=Dillenia turbinata TaxID=194707 RepID=A0AAN8VD52_9MAGN